MHLCAFPELADTEKGVHPAYDSSATRHADKTLTPEMLLVQPK